MESISPKFLAGASVFVASGAGILLACYLNIRNTRGPKERTFLILSTFGLLAFLGAVLALMYFLPKPYNFLTLVPFFLVAPFLIYRSSLRRQLIRELESREDHPPLEGQTKSS